MPPGSVLSSPFHFFAVVQCQSLIDELSASHSTDLQQIAYELQALLGLDARAVETIMPYDASCEDIEVIPYFLIHQLLPFQIIYAILARWMVSIRHFLLN